MKQRVLCLLLAISGYAVADHLKQPTGKVVLTVTGQIQHTLDGQQVTFDLEQLKQLPSDTFTLHTRWADREHEFHGPLLSAVLDQVGAYGSTLHMTALNDYSITIDRIHIDKYQPILAWKNDGQPMSVREKGPLWLLFPHDQYPELNEEFYTSKMIWQLSNIEIR
jgi:hypothetical protein